MIANSDDRFSRLRLLYGDAALVRLHQAHVAVFGVGGVGSYVVEALVRGGIGRLTLVDFDDVCRSNINRQLHALESTLGRPKVEVMAERCRQINPQIEISIRPFAYTSETAAELLAADYAYVCDCIDTISAKIHLIQSCCEQKLPIIASMGAANKLDPSQIRLADLAETKKCRLARTMRRELRKRGIERGVQVVYSTEEFRPLLTDSDDRTPLLGSASFIPPIFGLTMAAEVLRKISGIQ
jgi:tRNA A37 threonylcarbamoyladenosine dehydratase